MPNLTDDLSTAKERRLNQFGTKVLVRCGKSLTESVELLSNLTLARHNGTPSESDVAPGSFQSRTFLVKSGT